MHNEINDRNILKYLEYPNWMEKNAGGDSWVPEWLSNTWKWIKSWFVSEDTPSEQAAQGPSPSPITQDTSPTTQNPSQLQSIQISEQLPWTVGGSIIGALLGYGLAPKDRRTLLTLLGTLLGGGAGYLLASGKSRNAK